MKIFLFLIIPILLIIAGYFIYHLVINKNKTEQNGSIPNTSSQTPQQTSVPETAFTFPIEQFKERITKKPFGIYITPKNSPVSPEKFSGYHAGVDVEYTDIAEDVPVYAISDGKVVLSKTASGYGGVFMIEIIIDSKPHTVLYGHIRPSNLPKIGQAVKKGEKIAILGTGYSAETDGERKHLHFAVLSDNSLNILGYVQNKSELSSWIGPLSLYK